MEQSSRRQHELGELIRRHRLAGGMSLRGLAAAAGMNATYVMRLERGSYSSPDPRHLRALADVLGIEPVDLFVAADYRGGEGLPGFGPYLRAKYDLPSEAVDQLAAHFELVNDKYRAGGASDDKPDR